MKQKYCANKPDVQVEEYNGRRGLDELVAFVEKFTADSEGYEVNKDEL